MKRNNLFALILFIESLLFPVVTLLSKIFHYSIKVGNGLLYAVITTVVYYIIGILLVINKDKQIGKAHAVLLAVTLLLNQINALFFIFIAENIAENMLAIILIVTWIVITAVAAAIHIKSIGLKVTFYVLSGILVYPIIFVCLFGNLSVNTVLAHEISPENTYCAEVVDNDQGALGGATLLNVYKYDESFSVGSIEFRKDEREIYSGRWGEYKSLHWDDDSHVVLNDITYAMSEYFR